MLKKSKKRSVLLVSNDVNVGNQPRKMRGQIAIKTTSTGQILRGHARERQKCISPLPGLSLMQFMLSAALAIKCVVVV